MAKYLLDYLNPISDKINEIEEVLLFLDYDGTLVPFKNRPHEVVTPQEVKTVLTDLLKHPKFFVFIVSGRMLKEIKQLLNIDGLSYVALHGLQIELSNKKEFFWEQANTVLTILKEIRDKALKIFKNEKRVKIEDKRFTLAFHYRLLPDEKIKKIIEKFEEIIMEIDTNEMLDLIYGAKVVEARPKGWDKGRAVELILNNVLRTNNFLPVYIGDDTTDEDAFLYLEKQGLTIFVSNKTNKPTNAKYWLKDENDVLVFLKYLTRIKKTI
jgi:trehalose 6-phosphate phosphatase